MSHIMLTRFQGYDLEFMKNIRLINAWPDGRVEWELEITDFYANLNGLSLIL